MSDEHKSAIQSGRAQTKVVREYLEVLENRRPMRGPRPDPTKMRDRIESIDTELTTAEPLERVTLHQERMDLERPLEALERGTDSRNSRPVSSPSSASTRGGTVSRPRRGWPSGSPRGTSSAAVSPEVATPYAREGGGRTIRV